MKPLSRRKRKLGREAVDAAIDTVEGMALSCRVKPRTAANALIKAIIWWAREIADSHGGRPQQPLKMLIEANQGPGGTDWTPAAQRYLKLKMRRELKAREIRTRYQAKAQQ